MFKYIIFKKLQKNKILNIRIVEQNKTKKKGVVNILDKSPCIYDRLLCMHVVCTYALKNKRVHMFYIECLTVYALVRTTEHYNIIILIYYTDSSFLWPPIS